jgi:hypothetical protein
MSVLSAELAGAAELVQHCLAIAGMRRSVEEWAVFESCDQFQSPHFCGGFEADEKAFCFSYYDLNGTESWFTLSLSQAQAIAQGASVALELRESS